MTNVNEGAANPAQKTVLLGVTGCIAAYKSCEIVRGLQKAGVRVKVVMTEHATEFVGPTTFRALTHETVAVGLFDDPSDPIHHVSLAQEADVFLIAPCTANVIAKIANGIADDLLTTTALATTAPLVIAPAMNVNMYENGATHYNIGKLHIRGARFIDAGDGYLACGDIGKGRLAEVDDIVSATLDELGVKRDLAGPSVPVEIAGLSEAPVAGAPFFAVADERMARELVEQRKAEERAKAAAPVQKVSLENLFDQIKSGERKELALIVKADVQGSVEAVKASLEKLSNEEVNVRVIHGAVGAINESDVTLAAASNAIIVGFNVRPDSAAHESAARQNVDMRMYRVIYDAIDEIETAMKGMLAPKYREVVLGHAEVRETYKVSSVGTVAGCYVQDGCLRRDCSVRVVRDGIVVHEGVLGSLQRFKDSVKEVKERFECGLTVEKFNDIKLGDIIEGYTMEEIPR